MGLGRPKSVIAKNESSGYGPGPDEQFRLRTNPTRIVLEHAPGCFNARLVRRWASLGASWSWGMWCPQCDAGLPEGQAGKWTIGDELPPKWNRSAEVRQRADRRGLDRRVPAPCEQTSVRTRGLRAGREVDLPRSLRAVLAESLGPKRSR